ncbi:hypothetical protein V9T40_000374 [Parthenolecanium corni]|uniref:Uncharacterized protein n=1 Tax=Parthenolecanium corni TaxID=536013 RepID=A0AAN9Y1J3_9HEMI
MAVSLSLPPDCGADLNSLAFGSDVYPSPEANVSSSSGTLKRFSRGFPSCLRGASSPDEYENCIFDDESVARSAAAAA